MNTNMTGFRWVFFKNLCVLVLWMKVASALEAVKNIGDSAWYICMFNKHVPRPG